MLISPSDTEFVFSDLEIAVLKYLQDDLPVVARPFAYIGNQTGCSEQFVLALIEKLQSVGIIRRFGASLRHLKTGFTHNALLVWDVDNCAEAQIDQLGAVAAEQFFVSHCYLRPGIEGQWALYTMLHAVSEDELERFGNALSGLFINKVSGLKPPLRLKSLQELKKTSMHYF